MLLPNGLASQTHFHFAYEFCTRKLACKLNSLVRVSRRLFGTRFGRIKKFPQASSSFRKYSESAPHPAFLTSEQRIAGAFSRKYLEHSYSTFVSPD